MGNSSFFLLITITITLGELTRPVIEPTPRWTAFTNVQYCYLYVEIMKIAMNCNGSTSAIQSSILYFVMSNEYKTYWRRRLTIADEISNHVTFHHEFMIVWSLYVVDMRWMRSKCFQLGNFSCSWVWKRRTERWIYCMSRCVTHSNVVEGLNLPQALLCI